MQIFGKLALIASLGIAASCTPVQQVTRTGTTPVTNEFYVATTSWKRANSEISILFLARDNNGFVEICGGIYTDGLSSQKALEGELLSRVTVKIGDVRVMDSLTHFTRYDSKDEVDTIPANCATTGVVWQSGFSSADAKLRSRNNRFEG